MSAQKKNGTLFKSVRVAPRKPRTKGSNSNGAPQLPTFRDATGLQLPNKQRRESSWLRFDLSTLGARLECEYCHCNQYCFGILWGLVGRVWASRRDAASERNERDRRMGLLSILKKLKEKEREMRILIL